MTDEELDRYERCKVDDIARHPANWWVRIKCLCDEIRAGRAEMAALKEALDKYKNSPDCRICGVEP